MVELMLMPGVTQLWLVAMVTSRDGDVPLDLLMREVLSMVLSVVPWSRRLKGLEHLSMGWAGMDALPFVGVAGGVAVFHRCVVFDQHMDAAPRHPSNRLPRRSHLHEFNALHCNGYRITRYTRFSLVQEVMEDMAFLVA
jgi:hypothetical protein